MVQYLVTGLLYASLCSHIDSLIPPPPEQQNLLKSLIVFSFIRFSLRAHKAGCLNLCVRFFYISVSQIYPQKEASYEKHLFTQEN